MKRFDILDSLVSQGNGYLCTSQALKHGVSKPTMAHYVRKRNMERVAHGVYLAEDAWPDTLYQLHLSNSRIIFSHETALMLHGLTAVSYTHLTLPTILRSCRSRWSPYH